MVTATPRLDLGGLLTLDLAEVRDLWETALPRALDEPVQEQA
ncbi:MAG: hypothetical protein ACRD0K_02310 [Egibacteraceae bacterium]